MLRTLHPLIMIIIVSMYAGPQSPGGALVIPDPNIGRRLTVIWIEVNLDGHPLNRLFIDCVINMQDLV